MSDDYNKLKKFVENLGYKVIESDCDSWHYESRIICNNVRRNPQNRVIYLSHEAGHASIYDFNKEEYIDIFPGFAKDGIKKKVSEIEQEVLAWDEGLKIMRNLQIHVDLKRFAKIKTMCLQGYL